MIDYRSFRFSWIPITGVVVAFVGFPMLALGLLTKNSYIIVFAIGVVAFVFGNLLIVFFPKQEHADYFKLPHKMLVIGFTCFALSGLVNALGLFSNFIEFFFFISSVIFVSGMIGMSRS